MIDVSNGGGYVTGTCHGAVTLERSGSNFPATSTRNALNAFKKRRKAHDRFYLSPLHDSSSTPGVAIVSSTSVSSPSRQQFHRVEASHIAIPVEHLCDQHNDITSESAPTSPTLVLPLRKSKDEQLRLRSSKSRDPLVPHASRASAVRMPMDSPTKKVPTQVEPPPPLPPHPLPPPSSPTETPIQVLQQSLLSTFWSRHLTPSKHNRSLSCSTANDEMLEPQATGAIHLDDDIRAFCQRGPVSQLSRSMGKAWLTNMLRAYDVPSLSQAAWGDVETERQLHLVIAQAQCHFQQGDNPAFVTALLNAVANDIWDSCAHDFVHTVAGYYRDLLTHLPTLLKEREAKLEVAHHTIVRLEDAYEVLRKRTEALGRDKSGLQARVDAAEATVHDQHGRIVDMEGVLRDAVAAELMATATVKQLELQYASFTLETATAFESSWVGRT
ncbi:hypothetical protein AaE_010515 [Aphanomyces astaci]|uniref:Uncharacterized protein n=1 Tax=Aphanomyces astaci TaxID=112090 RepID=A0A6A5A6A0_APHAT|nr:hypothetical protein AaE_010515 [Aphanomyces astaci]